MAIAFVAATSAAGSSVTATSVSVTMPTGSVGDLLLVSVSASSKSTAGDGPAIVTAGSTNMVLLWSANTIGWVGTYVFYRIVASGDPTSYSFTANTGVPLAAVAARYSGVDSDTPFRNWNSAVVLDSSNHTASSQTLPQLDNVQANDMVVTIGAEGGSTKSTTITALGTPSGWTSRVTKTGPTASTAYPTYIALWDALDGTTTPSISGATGQIDVFSVALIPTSNPVTDVTGGTITFRAAATAATTATGAASLSVNKPSGVQNGDLLIMAAAQSSGFAIYTPPAGWTSIEEEIGGASYGTSSSSAWVASQVWYKVASGEPTSYSVSCTSGNANEEMTLAIVSYFGLRSPYPIKLHGGQFSTTTTATSATPYALPNINSDNLVVLVYTFGGGSSGTITVTGPSSPWTQRAQAISAVSDFNSCVTFADALGSTATPTATSSITGGWTVHSIALVGTPPVSALPPPPVMQTPLAPRLHSVNW